MPAAATPTVAIVGRPNVGKSTLFNRLVGRRQAIVHDLPGITRDRIVGRLELDDERHLELIDTGGLSPGDDPLGLGDQVYLAIEESDLLLLVVDGKEGLSPADQQVWEEIRRRGRPAILVVNKSDTLAAQQSFDEFYRLGLERQVLVSAEHGRGIGELLEIVAELLPVETAEDEDDETPSIAIVGRPNVGKSSLVNRLLGQPRVLVSPQAGTTRDPVDTLLEWQDRSFRLIDTAGIRRRSQVTSAAEDIAVLFARRQIERADIVVLLIDVAQGISSGDLAIAGEAWKLGRGVVVACNKWDLIAPESREQLDLDWPRLQEILASPIRVNLSALTGRHVDRLLPAITVCLERFRLEIPTSAINQLLEQAIARHQPPQIHGKPWKLFYATQVSTAPPTFLLFANRRLSRSDTYRRYLENRLRSELDLDGIPIRLVVRRR